MRNPILVLENLTKKSTDKSYKYERLYRNLYNPEFYLLAYSRSYAKEGNMTEGTDGKNIDGMSIERINKIIEKLKDESYQPNPARRVYIPKKNGSKRPLGIPSFEDKLVQMVIALILETIFNSTFSEKSHGFRRNKSCHTALTQVKNTYNGTKWWVEGDINGFFDNIDHTITIGLLRKRINDEKFIRLIWKFLRAGYLEEWKFNKTYSGTPQGGIISPILANIYLNELDEFMKVMKSNFDKGKDRKINSEYTRIRSKIKTLNRRLEKVEPTSDEAKKMENENKELHKAKLKIPYGEPMDENYKRLQYVRYADDFLIGVIGNKADADKIKEEITNFLRDKLKLELSHEKTLITNSKNPAKFLGYNISINRSEQVKTIVKNGKKVQRRNYVSIVHLAVPKEKWMGKLIELKAMKIEGKTWKPIHRKPLTNLDDLEILSIYNAEIKGLYNYYKLAANVSVLNKFYYIMEYSMYKTFANKYRTSMQKIISKYKINGKFGIQYNTKQGLKMRFLYNDGFKKQTLSIKEQTTVDTKMNTAMYSGRTSLIERLTAEKCEWCGATKIPLEIHHVRKLKDLKGKKTWEKVMISRNRKTIALCATGHGNDCHRKLHAGLLD